MTASAPLQLKHSQKALALIGRGETVLHCTSLSQSQKDRNSCFLSQRRQRLISEKTLQGNKKISANCSLRDGSAEIPADERLSPADQCSWKRSTVGNTFTAHSGSTRGKIRSRIFRERQCSSAVLTGGGGRAGGGGGGGSLMTWIDRGKHKGESDSRGGVHPSSVTNEAGGGGVCDRDIPELVS